MPSELGGDDDGAGEGGRGVDVVGGGYLLPSATPVPPPPASKMVPPGNCSRTQNPDSTGGLYLREGTMRTVGSDSGQGLGARGGGGRSDTSAPAGEGGGEEAVVLAKGHKIVVEVRGADAPHVRRRPLQGDAGSSGRRRRRRDEGAQELRPRPAVAGGGGDASVGGAVAAIDEGVDPSVKSSPSGKR